MSFKIKFFDVGRECRLSDGTVGRVVDYVRPFTTMKGAEVMVRIYVPKMDDSFFCTDDGRPDHNWTHRHTGCLHAWPAVVGWAKDRLTITKADIGRLFLNKKGNLCRILFVSVEQEDGIHPVTAVERPSEKVFHLSEDGFWVNHRYTSDLDFDTWYTNKVEEKEETLDGKQVTIDGKTYQLTLKK